MKFLVVTLLLLETLINHYASTAPSENSGTELGELEVDDAELVDEERVLEKRYYTSCWGAHYVRPASFMWGYSMLQGDCHPGLLCDDYGSFLHQAGTWRTTTMALRVQGRCIPRHGRDGWFTGLAGWHPGMGGLPRVSTGFRNVVSGFGRGFHVCHSQQHLKPSSFLWGYEMTRGDCAHGLLCDNYATFLHEAGSRGSKHIALNLEGKCVSAYGADGWFSGLAGWHPGLGGLPRAVASASHTMGGYVNQRDGWPGVIPGWYPGC